MEKTQESRYRREQRLARQGLHVRRLAESAALHNEYGEKLRWVVDLGGHRQARLAYKTREDALRAAEAYLL